MKKWAKWLKNVSGKKYKGGSVAVRNQSLAELLIPRWSMTTSKMLLVVLTSATLFHIGLSYLPRLPANVSLRQQQSCAVAGQLLYLLPSWWTYFAAPHNLLIAIFSITGAGIFLPHRRQQHYCSAAKLNSTQSWLLSTVPPLWNPEYKFTFQAFQSAEAYSFLKARPGFAHWGVGKNSWSLVEWKHFLVKRQQQPARSCWLYKLRQQQCACAAAN